MHHAVCLAGIAQDPLISVLRRNTLSWRHGMHPLHLPVPRNASLRNCNAGSTSDTDMEDLRWAEETASVFGDEAAQMQIDSSGAPQYCICFDTQCACSL